MGHKVFGGHQHFGRIEYQMSLRRGDQHAVIGRHQHTRHAQRHARMHTGAYFPRARTR